MPGRHVTDNQMRLFMNYTGTHTVETAAAKAGFSASTGHRIRRDPRLPSQKVKPRGSRRRRRAVPQSQAPRAPGDAS